VAARARRKTQHAHADAPLRPHRRDECVVQRRRAAGAAPLTRVNLGTAFQRLAKLGAPLPAPARDALLSDPRTLARGCAHKYARTHLHGYGLTHAHAPFFLPRVCVLSAELQARLGELSGRSLVAGALCGARTRNLATARCACCPRQRRTCATAARR
jgi:hypothetical protein